MSIELNWETLTSGPDGEALAERIRTFIHDKFQTVPLPRFIRSVTVHGFDFGTIPPTLDLKDITDPLPDFYDGDLYEDESDDEDDYYANHEPNHYHDHHHHAHGLPHHHSHHQKYAAGTREGDQLRAAAAAATAAGSEGSKKRAGGLRNDMLRNAAWFNDMGSPFLGTSTPGILGGPGLNYFQGHLGTGTHTPLAAVAGAHLGHSSWLGSPVDSDGGFSPSHSRNPSQSSISVDNFNGTSAGASTADRDQIHALREKSSVSTLAPTSVSTSRPPTRDAQLAAESAITEEDDHGDGAGAGGPGDEDEAPRPRREPRVEDVQAVFRIRYSGDIRLNLTAEILLDYPMPSFVGIPLKLNITGMSFDGVSVLAHIRKRVHFCFLSPEDAMTAVGPDDDKVEEDAEQNKQGQGSNAATNAKQSPGNNNSSSSKEHKARLGGLLQEIKVESEIGEQEGGKQSLKNVGKVERFVLEQVRRIFEEEFVYPSFWTFLV